MIYKETIPSNIPEGVWDEKSCVRRQSGFTIDQSKLPATLKWLSKGAPLALNSSGKVVLCKTAKVYENAWLATLSQVLPLVLLIQAMKILTNSQSQLLRKKPIKEQFLTMAMQARS